MPDLDITAPRTDARWAQLILQAAASGAAVSPAELLHMAGLRAPDWSTERRIDQGVITAIWTTAAHHAGRPEIGLDLMQHLHPSAIGALAFELMAAPTFREAAQDFFRHSPLISDMWQFDLQEIGNRAIVRIRPTDPNAPVSHHSLDAIVGACVLMTRDWLSGGRIAYDEVEFAHPDFGRGELYAQRLGCRCRFNTAETRLSLPADRLALAMPAADADIHAAIHASLESRQRDTKDLRASIEQCIRRRISAGAQFSRALVAEELQMSERVLLRRLADQRLSFRQVSEQLVESLARRWLMRQPAESVAEQLGYCDAAALGKMIKRRTGQTITELRRQAGVTTRIRDA